jgi:hypothetical protein
VANQIHQLDRFASTSDMRAVRLSNRIPSRGVSIRRAMVVELAVGSAS